MSVSYIRESIEKESILSSENLIIVQKKVELRRSSRHEILACDIFQDSICTTNEDNPTFIEMFVTPYPVIYSNMLLTTGMPNRGPVAANDTILFKAVSSSFNVNTTNYLSLEQFPSPQIGAGPSFAFYTPAVYFTMFIHVNPIDEVDVQNLAFSFMLKVKSTKASATQYGLGMIRERSLAQGIELMNQGRVIPPAANVGQIFPQWRYGGIRPERMIDGTAARNFWLNYSADSAEAMLDTPLLRAYVRNARVMNPYDAAFGNDTVSVGAIPDWIRFGLNRGLVAGPIRAQQPPRKLSDNGNTLMF
jgi:hypothetical protein